MLLHRWSLACMAVALASAARVPGSPFPAPALGLNASSELFVVDYTALSADDVFTLQVMQGSVNRDSPRLIRTDAVAYPPWIAALSSTFNIQLNSSMDLPHMISFAASQGWLRGYILASLQDNSSFAAYAAAAALGGGILAVTPVNIGLASAANLTQLLDVRGMTLQAVVAQLNASGAFSTNLTIIQAPAWQSCLSEYAVFSRALMWWDDDPVNGSTFAWATANLTPPFLALGWGPDEHDTVTHFSALGGGIIGSNFANDLDVFSAYDVPALQQKPAPTGQAAPTAAVHTVCLVMTDGDNVQWVLNAWANPAEYPQWYASPSRGLVDIGWTLSLSLADLAPAVMGAIYANASDGSTVQRPGRDVFIGGGSGIGYMYPDTENASALAGLTALTAAYMNKAGMRITNVLGNTYSPALASAYLNNSGIDAVVWYLYDDYSGMNGTIDWPLASAGIMKPVLGGRYNLWGNGSQGLRPDFMNVSQLATSLAALPRDPSSADGYSLIPVHVWSHDVDDLVLLQTLLQDLAPGGGVELVTPDVYLQRIMTNLAPTAAAAAAAAQHAMRTPLQCSVNGSLWNASGFGMVMNGLFTGALAIPGLPDSTTSVHIVSLYGYDGFYTGEGNISADGRTITIEFSYRADRFTETGVLADDCQSINWGAWGVWNRAEANEVTAGVTHVHTVFMTHLDIGFTALAHDVCELYFTSHLPAAIATTETLASWGFGDVFAYTTHPILVFEYLFNFAGCSRTPRNASQLAFMRHAIEANTIRWHGKWGNLFPELMDGPLFNRSLWVPRFLNGAFNKTWGARAAKSSDVPGLSRSVIPWLSANGIASVHMGYNWVIRIPDIPPAFVWHHLETNTSVLALVNQNYGTEVALKESSHALAFKYQVDNTEPPTPQEVLLWLAAVRVRFPAAVSIVADGLDGFVDALLPIANQLPQVNGEIGDTWLYGAPADPYRLSLFRELRRLRNDMVADGTLDGDDANLVAYEMRQMIGCPEHNWGVDTPSYISGYDGADGNWTNAAFHAVRGRADYQFVESGWDEKRDFLLPGAMVAPPSGGFLKYAAAATAAATAALPSPLNTSSYVHVTADQSFTCGRYTVLFNVTTGAVASLRDSSGAEWVAASSAGLGAVTYRTYTEAEFDAFDAQFTPGCGPPCGCFSKVGMDAGGHPAPAIWPATLVQLWQQTRADATCSFLSQLQLDPETVQHYGGMQSLWLNVTINSAPDEHAFEVTWFNKTATRLAEAVWVSFVPAVNISAMARFSMDVLGHAVDPLSVVSNGAQHLHAVWDGVTYAEGEGSRSWSLSPLDTPLVAPGDADHLLRYDGTSSPDLSGGWHWLMHANAWDTAFPEWYDDDARARFVFRTPPVGGM